jgi:hypothetical protein
MDILRGCREAVDSHINSLSSAWEKSPERKQQLKELQDRETRYQYNLKIYTKFFNKLINNGYHCKKRPNMENMDCYTPGLNVLKNNIKDDFTFVILTTKNIANKKIIIPNNNILYVTSFDDFVEKYKILQNLKGNMII